MISKNSCLKIAVIPVILSICAIMLQGQKTVVFNELHKPEALYVDGERVYIAEGNVIKVFALTDGKNICVYDSKEGFFIEIFDHEGKKVAT